MTTKYSSIGMPDHYIWYQSSSDPKELLEAEVTVDSIHTEHGRTLLITVYDAYYPITEDLLHQVFDKYGKVEMIHILPWNQNFQAFLRYEFFYSLVSAKLDIHGRNIYDGCCRLDLRYVSKMFLENVLSDCIATVEKEVEKNEVVKPNSTVSESLIQSEVFVVERELLDISSMDAAHETENSLEDGEITKNESQVFDEIPVRILSAQKTEEVSGRSSSTEPTKARETVQSEAHMFDDMPVKDQKVEGDPKVFDKIPDNDLNEMDEKPVDCQLFVEMLLKGTMMLAEMHGKRTMVLDEISLKDAVAFKLPGKIAIKEMDRDNSFVNFIADDFEKNGSHHNEGILSLAYARVECIDKDLFDPGGYSVSEWKLRLLFTFDLEVIHVGLSDMDLRFLRDVEIMSLSYTHVVAIYAGNLSLIEVWQKILIDCMAYFMMGMCISAWKLFVHFLAQGKYYDIDINAKKMLGHKYIEGIKRQRDGRFVVLCTNILKQLDVQMEQLTDYKFYNSSEWWHAQYLTFHCLVSSFLFRSFMGSSSMEAATELKKKISYQELKEFSRGRIDNLFISFCRNLFCDTDMNFRIFCHNQLKDTSRFDSFLAKYVEEFQHSGSIDESLKILTEDVVFGLKLTREVLGEVVVWIMKEISTRKALVLTDANQTDVAHLFCGCLTVLSAFGVAIRLVAPCDGVNHILLVFASSKGTSRLVDANDYASLLRSKFLMSLVFHVAVAIHCHHFSFGPTTSFEDLNEQLFLLRNFTDAAREKQDDEIVFEWYWSKFHNWTTTSNI